MSFARSQHRPTATFLNETYFVDGKFAMAYSVADPEFHNGGANGRGGGGSPQKKIEFLPENGGFWSILGLLFTFMQKFVRPMGGGRPPAPSGSATGRSIQVPLVMAPR